MTYTAERSFDSPVGKVTVRIDSSEPINESDYLLFRRGAAIAMAECAIKLAEAMKPIGGSQS